MTTGTIPSTGPAFNSATIAAALLNGDATVSITGLPYNGSGILVAIPEHGYEIPLNGILTPQTVTRFVTEWVEHAVSAILTHPAPFYSPRYFGSWTDNGILYLDIVEAFPREEIEEAIAAGAARGQIAIYDNGRKEAIVIGEVA